MLATVLLLALCAPLDCKCSPNHTCGCDDGNPCCCQTKPAVPYGTYAEWRMAVSKKRAACCQTETWAPVHAIPIVRMPLTASFSPSRMSSFSPAFSRGRACGSGG